MNIEQTKLISVILGTYGNAFTTTTYNNRSQILSNMDGILVIISLIDSINLDGHSQILLIFQMKIRKKTALITLYDIIMLK